MGLTLSISLHGRPLLERDAENTVPPQSALVAQRIEAGFAAGDSAGLLHLATVELQTPLPASLAYARDFARTYLTRLCHTPGLSGGMIEPLAAPSPEELAFTALQAPPMKGLEYLNVAVLEGWWTALDEHVRRAIADCPAGAAEYLREKNPLWRLIGRVTFHLAENKRDDIHPFAFMATYAHRLSEQGRVQHLPLRRALEEYAGAKNRSALVSLLTPIHQAAERLEWVKSLVEGGGVYQPLAWTPREAHRFLQAIPALEEAGLIVRVPDWWKAKSPPRPQVSVKIGDRAGSKLGVDALLDFNVGVTLAGEGLSESELRDILASAGGLVRLRGQWVEVDREKLAAALEQWKRVESASREGISFYEGMRLLSGANVPDGGTDTVAEPVRQWTGIVAGEHLERALAQMRDPQAAEAPPPGLRAQLRPYQHAGVGWLRFMSQLGLGACLADDMGLGKTIQVLSLLLHLRGECSTASANAQHTTPPSLLVVPASLIANWKAEIGRFAPALSFVVAHPSEGGSVEAQESASADVNLVITTYGMLTRMQWLLERRWRLVILDEAQAIKNSGTRQSKAVKELQTAGRIAMTGTPVENRLSDLWSLFDFLNPGLLGGAKPFAKFVKRMGESGESGYGPLRTLVRPYILRRLKTDKRIIADLPDKTEVKAFCALSKRQAAMYEHAVRELGDTLATADGIQRRGIVLAYLMRLKQICNHPAQWTGDGDYDPQHSGKFHRLTELCAELAERQEKALVFTQFREITEPLAEHLRTIFGRSGLVLHGSTSIARRREMVESFQRDEGPPFFVLSLKAGGTGLNLTAASHVIHFDRWWNPAVENQATDRAFRIGQKRNVLVHKFVCRGTVEEKIDAMISEKLGLSRDLLDEADGAEKRLTEMDNDQLLRFVSLDIGKAMEG